MREKKKNSFKYMDWVKHTEKQQNNTQSLSNWILIKLLHCEDSLEVELVSQGDWAQPDSE